MPFSSARNNFNRFHENTDDIFRQILSLNVKSYLWAHPATVFSTRLMAGKIDVEHLDVQFPANICEEVPPMPNFISEDQIEKATVDLLHDRYGYRA